jgi:orotate phosphoribosyltransferase
MDQTKIDTERKEKLGKEIMEGLYETGMILTWYRDKPKGWILASGLWSPFYINLRLLSSHPKLYKKAGEALGIMLRSTGFKSNGKDKVVGIAMAGVPLANAVTLEAEIPSLYTRKLPEDVKTPGDVDKYVQAHGQHSLVEGELNSGDRLALIDDLVTKFDSKLLAIGQIEQEIKRRGLTGIQLKEIFVLLDREQGGAEKAKSMGFELHALIPFASKGIGWLKGSLSDIEYSTIVDYIKNTQKYQSKEMQEELEKAAKK